MTEEQRRRGPAATQVEDTGQNVRANVARLRKARGLSTYQLALKLKESGRPIPQSGISRIESGSRRVDVDDLTALAHVLGVSPAALLLPFTDSPHDLVPITGAGSVPADQAWDWANGKRPLRLTAGREQTELMEHQLFGMPQWLRTTVQGPVTGKLTDEGTDRTNAFREAFQQEHGRLPDRNEVLNWLFGVNPEGRDDG